MVKYCLLLLSLCTLLACNNNRPATALKVTQQGINPFGRAIVDADSNIVLIGSASYIELSFTGTSCALWMKNSASWNDYNYVVVELDDQYNGRLKINGSGFKPYTVTAPDNKQHTVRIYKATEAMNGQVLIESIAAAAVKALPHPPRKKIEFIGNSITSGTGSDVKDIPCGTDKWYDQHNAYWSYAPRVARALNADYILSSVSGIGIYRTWNADGPSMPEVYEHTYLDKDHPLSWDFSRYTPDVVSIALGTNDLSEGAAGQERTRFDSTVFINKYVAFINLLYQHYPNTQIALLSSPMISGEKGVMLSACLERVQGISNAAHPGKLPVEVFNFPSMQTHGCGGHPTIEEQGLMADQLIPFFTGLLDSRKKMQ
jgi:lysophospholipase L1-like esterase